MLDQQPVVTTAGSRQRRFATLAVAIQAIIINQAEEILLLFSSTRKQGWQEVSGALEAGETLLGYGCSGDRYRREEHGLAGFNGSVLTLSCAIMGVGRLDE